jgi:hypothetical protein
VPPSEAPAFSAKPADARADTPKARLKPKPGATGQPAPDRAGTLMPAAGDNRTPAPARSASTPPETTEQKLAMLAALRSSSTPTPTRRPPPRPPGAAVGRVPAQRAQQLQQEDDKLPEYAVGVADPSGTIERTPTPAAPERAQRMAKADTIPDYADTEAAKAAEAEKLGQYTIELEQGEEARQLVIEENKKKKNEEQKIEAGVDTSMFTFVIEIIWTMMKAVATPAKFFAGPFAVIGGITVLVLYLGATSVDGAESRAIEAQDALVSTTSTEHKALVEDIASAGGNAKLLRQLAAEFDHAQTPEAKAKAADKLVVALENEKSKPGVSTELRRRGNNADVEMSLGRMRKANDEARIAHATWVEAATSTRGQWAITAGIAAAPPDEQ